MIRNNDENALLGSIGIAFLLSLILSVYTFAFDIVRKIRPPGELMRKGKLVEISGGKCVDLDLFVFSHIRFYAALAIEFVLHHRFSAILVM